MIRVERQPEPESFDALVRQPGQTWLEAHPPPRTQRLPAKWRACVPDLEDAFRGLCAYQGVHLFGNSPTVDHWVPQSRAPELAYEWTNYRYASGAMNTTKGNEPPENLVDPFEVQDDWFELRPSLVLVVTDKCPEEQRERARYTLRRLGLDHGEQVIRTRRTWMNQWARGLAPLSQLDEVFPQLARLLRRLDDEALQVLRDEYSRR